MCVGEPSQMALGGRSCQESLSGAGSVDIYTQHKHRKYSHTSSSRQIFQIRVLWIVLAAIIMTALNANAQSPVDKAWSILKSGLTDSHVDNRATAVGVLGLLENNPEALKLALVALGDEISEVRSAAAKALGDMNAKPAAPKLVEVIRGEKDVSVVIAGAHSLVALGDPFGYAVYYAVLTGERKSGGGLLDDQRKMLKDPRKMVQFGFEQGIGFIPFAGIGYGTLKALRRDDTSPVRAAATKVLADDPDPRSREALVEATSDKSWLVRAAALDALSHRGDPNVLTHVAAKMDDENEAVRYTAAATLIHLSDVQAGEGSSKKP